jgi:hypothetical protein
MDCEDKLIDTDRKNKRKRKNFCLSIEFDIFLIFYVQVVKLFGWKTVPNSAWREMDSYVGGRWVAKLERDGWLSWREIGG